MVAGSALATLSFFRAILIAVYPLFAPARYDNLGNNFAGSVLAAIATVYCFVAGLFWKFGRKVLERSPWVRVKRGSVDKNEVRD
jgi:hypothetical protein